MWRVGSVSIWGCGDHRLKALGVFSGLTDGLAYLHGVHGGGGCDNLFMATHLETGGKK